MSIFSKLFGRKGGQQKVKIGGMEDFMTLIRVYFQSVMAADLGITNMAALPDLRVFKATLKVPTVNNKLGVGEKSRCRKMLKDLYNMDDAFCKEIDNSVKKNCRRVQDIQAYMYQFQAYTQDLLMLTTNLMKFKLRMPSFLKSALYQMTEKTVNDLFNKNDYKDAGVMKTCLTIRQINNKLQFSQKWTTDFIYRVVMLAKKEKQPKTE
ncbi:MAG: hypothetical protein KBS65_02900 [Prevotella sp.]|nr:hypothetical protein [Candidatus Equicola stercoris]